MERAWAGGALCTVGTAIMVAGIWQHEPWCGLGVITLLFGIGLTVDAVRN